MDLEQFLIFAGLALLFCKSDSQITAQAPNEDSNQLRLVDGPGRCAGRVEIYHGARWGTICDDSWDKADADVVCKQLGCGHGVKATTGVYYGRGTGDIWLDGVECRGNETHIRDCPAQPFGDHNCDNEENAGVLCSGHIQYQLFDGPHRCSGYLVVQHGETWESVCEIDAELKTANVLCRELNCGEAVQTSWTFRRPGPIWSEQFHCVGNESRLYDCSRQDREGNCTKQVPAVIKCKAPVRLSGGDTECEGLMEVKYQEEWWGVNFYTSPGEIIANVVCRELGCETTNVQHRATRGKIFMDVYRRKMHIQCMSEPFSISQCKQYIYDGLHPSVDLIGVKCSGHKEYRLVNGPHQCSGYLVARHGNTWGSVCEIDEELKAATVFCRQLRCGEAVPTLLNGTRIPGLIWREQINCVGNESSLYDCIRRDIGGNCTKQRPPAIECKGYLSPVRLSGGNTECEGLVEVRYKEEWWGVDYYIISREKIADVVCRELGCNTTNVQPRVTRGEIFVDDRRRILDLRCTGEESILSHCEYKTYNNLHHSLFMIGVKCSGHREYRLVNGPHRCSGYLEARDGDTWGSVCEIDEELKAAKVICSELKCGEAVPTLLNYTRRPGPIWREQIHCVGNESSLYGCLRRDVEGNCTKQNPPAIECEVPVRLSGGHTECEGLVEVRFDGEWWVVNDMRGNTKYIADVVCRELGCNITNVQHRVTTGEIFVDDERMMLSMLLCNGEESSLSECGYVPFGLTKPSANLIGVRCSVPVRLSGGNTECEGLVEVRYEEWWAVEYNTDNRENIANVVCKELGCNTINIQHRVTRGDIFVDDDRKMLDLQCRGEESSLSQCEYSINGIQPSVRLMGVKCSALVRLSAGNTECEGLVEVRYLEKWWAMKYDTDNRETIANVLCRELGCNTTNVPHGVTTGDIFVDDARRMLHLRCRGEETSWSQCERSLYGNIFPTVLLIGVKCSGHREYRLADGPTACSGHLEARHGDTWGSVCEIDSELRAANVLCKELQCGEAVPSLMTYTRRPGPIWTEQIHCVGNESRLYDCIRNNKNRKCTKESAPSIQCKGLFNSYRLVNGNDRCSGRVEVLYEGQWMATCSSHWSLQEANVLCRQMKCGVAVSIPGGGHFGTYSVTTTYRFHCTGTEYHLGDCNITALGNSKCTSWDTAGVICTGKEETVRLMSGEDHCAGRLEILTHNIWSRAVSDQWGINETQVVCRELHCGHAVGSLPITASTTVGGHVYLSGNCQGNETQLTDCSVTESSNRKTWTGQETEIEMICSESNQLRLVDGPGRCAGRVEIYHDGRWGTICDDSWDKADADVVCKQLGCGYGVRATTGAYYGRGTGDIWLDDVECEGNETYIRDCPAKQFGDHDCGHKEDAGVVCSELLDLRLVDGSHECEGWLEVYYNGSWGSVCNNVMPVLSVSVICKHLNCGSKGYLEAAKYDVKRRRPFWVDHINCTKYNKLLWECPSSPWNINSCTDRELAYIVCEGSRTAVQSCPTSVPCSDNDRIHLIGGENNCSGRVEVFFQGEWGTVCDDEWDIKDAEVVCRQIGCGSAVNSTTEASYGKGAGPIWLSEVQCKGYERTLQDCWAKRWNKSDCLHKEDAGVVCLGPDDFSRTVLTTTPAQSPALPSTFTVSNVFFMISIISLLLLGIAVIIIIYLITQSKWHKKDPVYEDLAFTLMEKNKRLSQKSVDNLSDLEEKLEYYTSDERKYEKLDQGAESDQIPSYDDVDDINGENSPSSPLKKKTSEYDYDDAGLFYETNDVSATGVERNGKEHGYDDVDIELLSRSVNSGEVATHANNGQLGPSWEDVLHLSDEQIVSISDNQDEIHLSVDPDYDDSMSA